MAVVAVAAGGFAGCGSTGQATMKPGESMNAAAAKAGRDGIVFMDPGTYPAQTVNTGNSGDCVTNSGHTQDCRVFIAKPGVRIGNLRIEGAGTVVMAGHRGDLRIDGAYSLSGARESVIANAVIDPADGDPGVYLDHVTNFAVVGSEITGVRDNDGLDLYGGGPGVNGALVKNNDIHGVRLSANSCQHTDGVQSAQTSGQPNRNIQIVGNHIWDIDQNADIQLDSTPSGRATGVTVEGNDLGTVNYTPTTCVPTPYPRSITLSGYQVAVRDNSAAQPFFVYPGSGSITGNRAPRPQFSGGASCSTYAFGGNVWSANPYGTSCP